MARTSRSTRSSTVRTPGQDPEAAQSGIEPASAPEETQPALVLTRSKRQAKRRVTSGNIQRGKVRTARKAQKKKKRIESPNLSDTDFTGDDDDDNNDWDDEGPDESVAGLEDECEGAGDEEYGPETVALEDTDINSSDARSNRKLILERLQEATDKDFSRYSTEELRAFWKAYCADQEAADEVEVQYPQITRAAAFELSPRVISNPSPAVDTQTTRGKRALTESVDVASKRVCLSLDPDTNPSFVSPPSSNPHPIAPPNFPAHPAQTTQGAHPSGQAQAVGGPTPSASHAPLRTQNAPSPSLGRLAGFPTATTVLDSPACSPVHPRMATPAPRVATPAPPRVPIVAPSRVTPARAPALVAAPAPVAAPARVVAPPARAPAPAPAPARAPAPAPVRSPVPARARAPAPARARAPAPARARAPAPARARAPAAVPAARAPAPVVARARAPAPVVGPSRARAATTRPSSSRAPQPIASRNAAAASSRPPAAPTPPRADIPAGLRLPSVPEAEPDWGVDLGGPAPGVPARLRPYNAFTDLLDDRAEEIAEAEARQVGRRAVGRKPKRTAKDYHGDARRMIPHTVKRQFAQAIVEGAYDNRGIMIDLSQVAFEQMWSVLFPAKELQYPDEYYFPMITNRGATERGEVRKRIRPIVHNKIANFIHPACTREDMELNKAKVKQLLPRLFHYKVQDPPSEPFGSIEIQRALGAGLFHSVSAVGAIHRSLFGPLMPLQAMAFILTNIQVCIMEFADGSFQVIELNVAQQLNMYMDHLRGLEAYEQRAPNRLADMQKEWFKYAKAFAGIEDSEEEVEPRQSDLDLLADIPPDSPRPDDLEVPDELGVLVEPEAIAEPNAFAGSALDMGAPVDEGGWQQYRLEDLYGNDTMEAEPKYEPETEPEPEPEPQPEYLADGRLTARAKGKGRAAGGSGSRHVERRNQVRRPRPL